MNGTVRVLFKTRLIFPRINGPNVLNSGYNYLVRRKLMLVTIRTSRVKDKKYITIYTFQGYVK